jgi:thiamine biosynthesis lipoprotein
VLQGTTVTLPVGVVLDLGATAKAFAADRCARLVAEQTGAGILVSLGGDIATAGPGPSAGWQIRVSDGEDQPETAIGLPSGSAVATSSTIRRTWTHQGRGAHHILDPRTGLPAEPVWRTVTVAAPTCVTANTLSTAAVVRGKAATRWLDAAGVSARFVSASGRVLTVGGWPAERA